MRRSMQPRKSKLDGGPRGEAPAHRGQCCVDRCRQRHGVGKHLGESITIRSYFSRDRRSRPSVASRSARAPSRLPALSAARNRKFRFVAGGGDYFGELFATADQLGQFGVALEPEGCQAERAFRPAPRRPRRDRGMMTQARIDAELRPNGLEWTTALRAPAIRGLVEAGALQL
jgi:hypothetical protein